MAAVVDNTNTKSHSHDDSNAAADVVHLLMPLVQTSLHAGKLTVGRHPASIAADFPC
jgi:hypothetical protein